MITLSPDLIMATLSNEQAACSNSNPLVAGSVDPAATIKVLFFASAREAANGLTELMVTMSAPTKTATVDDDDDANANANANATITTTRHLRQILANQFPLLAEFVLDEDSITLAVNEEYVAAGENVPLKDGDVVALIPPISGG